MSPALAENAEGDAQTHHQTHLDLRTRNRRPLPTGLEVKPEETVELNSGSRQLILTARKWSLSSYGAQFEKAGTLDLNFRLRDAQVRPLTF